MALTTCPECGHQVSDQAAACPNCGFPMGATTADGAIDIGGSGRFSHEPSWRRVTIRWDPAKGSVAIGDAERSMLGVTRLEDLVVSGDDHGSYEIQRRRGNVKPIEFTPDSDSEFRHVVPHVGARSAIDRSVVAAGYQADAAYAPSPVSSQGAELGMGFTKTVAGFLFATAVAFGLASVVYLAAGDEYAAYLEDPLQPGDDISTAAAADGLYGLAAIGFLVCIVLFLIWFNKAYKAADSRGATGTKWSSGWSVGGWFIPFANLVIPKLVMNEIDRISHPGNDTPPIGEAWKGRPRLTSSDLWWASWILANIATGVEAVLSDSGATDDVVLWAAVGAGLFAAAGGLLGWTVLTIGRRLSATSSLGTPR